MVSGESQPKLPCVHSGGLWRPTKALRAGFLRLVVTQHALDHPLAWLAVAGRRSHSVRHDWARRPMEGDRRGRDHQHATYSGSKIFLGPSPLTPAKGQPKGASGPPKGGAQGRGSQGSTTEQHCRVRGPSRGCVPSRSEPITKLVLWGSNSRVECARANDRPVRGG
jgi:hypothetical protein